MESKLSKPGKHKQALPLSNSQFYFQNRHILTVRKQSGQFSDTGRCPILLPFALGAARFSLQSRHFSPGMLCRRSRKPAVRLPEQFRNGSSVFRRRSNGDSSGESRPFACARTMKMVYSSRFVSCRACQSLLLPTVSACMSVVLRTVPNGNCLRKRRPTPPVGQTNPS